MSDLVFKSRDGRFGARLGPDQLRRLGRYQRGADTLETGGTLIGRYSVDHRMAIIERITAARLI